MILLLSSMLNIHSVMYTYALFLGSVMQPLFGADMLPPSLVGVLLLLHLLYEQLHHC